MDDNIIIDSINQSISGLYTNQNILNEKIDSLLTICAKNFEFTNEIKQTFNQQILQFNALVSKVDSLVNKLSDMEIQMQNSNGDHDTITSSIQDVMLQVDDVKHTIAQWKIYSDIY